MKKYTFTCTCGHDMTVDAADMEEAQTKFKEMVTPEAARAHFEENHPGDEFPPYDAFMENALANLSEEPKEEENTMMN